MWDFQTQLALCWFCFQQKQTMHNHEQTCEHLCFETSTTVQQHTAAHSSTQQHSSTAGTFLTYYVWWHCCLCVIVWWQSSLFFWYVGNVPEVPVWLSYKIPRKYQNISKKYQKKGDDRIMNFANATFTFSNLPSNEKSHFPNCDFFSTVFFFERNRKNRCDCY